MFDFGYAAPRWRPHDDHLLNLPAVAVEDACGTRPEFACVRVAVSVHVRVRARPRVIRVGVCVRVCVACVCDCESCPVVRLWLCVLVCIGLLYIGGLCALRYMTVSFIIYKWLGFHTVERVVWTRIDASESDRNRISKGQLNNILDHWGPAPAKSAPLKRTHLATRKRLIRLGDCLPLMEMLMRLKQHSAREGGGSGEPGASR